MLLSAVFGENDGKEQEEARGWGATKFQPPPPPGPLLRDVSSEMGGPGAGGRGGGLGAFFVISVRCRSVARAK